MPAYRLAVIVPVDARAYRKAPANTVNVEHVFRIETPGSLEWMRANADELARRCVPGVEYVALMVGPEA